MSKRISLGVDWFMPGRKRRFATTTKASSDLISILAHDGSAPGPSWSQIVDLIRYDPEAKAVAQHFVDNGLGHRAARDMVSAP